MRVSEPHGRDVDDEGGNRRKALSASGKTELGRLLVELVMSLPPLANPTILARELCACSRKEAKSAVPSGWRTLPITLPPLASMKRVASRCIAWPKAKSAVRKNQPSPPCDAIALAALGNGVGVPGPMHADRRARFACEIDGRGARHQEDAILLLGDFLHCKRNRGVGHVDNGVHAVHVDPAPCNRGADIGLVLVVGVNDLDRLARGLAAEILDCHARRFDQPSPETDEKTPVSSVSTPNLTTPLEISACAASGAFFCAAAG